MEFTLPHTVEAGFDGLYGLVVTEVGDGLMRGEVAVRDDLLQPFGLVHGGVFSAVAETLASTGTYLAVQESGRRVMGLSNQTNFMRPITAGTVHGRARRIHAGRTTWIWDVECCDDQGRVCAVARVTVAVRPRRGG